MTTPETMYKTNPKNVEGLDITDPAAEAKILVNEIRSKVDVVVVLGHLGQDASSTDTSFKVVKEVPGIDVFIDGHSHTILQDGLVSDNGTLIASAGEYTNFVGVIDLWVDGGKVTKKQATLIDETEAKDIKPNEKVAALVNSIQKNKNLFLRKKSPIQQSCLMENANKFVLARPTWVTCSQMPFVTSAMQISHLRTAAVSVLPLKRYRNQRRHYHCTSFW